MSEALEPPPAPRPPAPRMLRVRKDWTSNVLEIRVATGLPNGSASDCTRVGNSGRTHRGFLF
jgi:hypothetical protein